MASPYYGMKILVAAASDRANTVVNLLSDPIFLGGDKSFSRGDKHFLGGVVQMPPT